MKMKKQNDRKRVQRVLFRLLIALLIAGAGTVFLPFKAYVSKARTEEPVLYIKNKKEAQGKSGTRISVPISIKNNPGIMGIGLEITYDKESLTAVDITAGEITKQGSLSTSIGGFEDTSRVKVLWSNVEEVRQDGILLNIEFQIKKGAKDGERNIKIKISPDDTFNESYENVMIESKPMKLIISKKASGNEVVNSAVDNYKTGSSKVMLIIISILGVLMLVTVIIILIIRRKRKQKQKILPETPIKKNLVMHNEEHKVPSAPEAGSITGLRGSNAGYTISMRDGEDIVIGKVSGKANLIISDEYEDVSRKHCLVRFNEKMNLYEVMDYSGNGTFFDGKVRMKTGQITMLPKGSCITLGNGENAFRLN